MTSLELVEAFEQEAGEPWFRVENGMPVTLVSPPYPGIVPTWPRLIRERAMAEVTNALTRAIEQADHDWLCAEEDISDPDQWTDDQLSAHAATLAAVLNIIWSRSKPVGEDLEG